MADRYDRDGVPEDIRNAYKEFLHDDDHRSLIDELAILRATLYQSLKKGEQVKAKDRLGLINGIRDLVKTIDDIETKQNYMVHCSVFQVLVNQIAEVVKEVVLDAKIREALAVGLAELSLPRPIQSYTATGELPEEGTVPEQHT